MDKLSRTKNLLQSTHEIECHLKKIIIQKVNAGESLNQVLLACKKEIQAYLQLLPKELEKPKVEKDLNYFVLTQAKRYHQRVSLALPLLAYSIAQMGKANKMVKIAKINSYDDVVTYVENVKRTLTGKDILHRGYPHIESYMHSVKDHMNSLIGLNLQERPVVNPRTGKTYYGRQLFAQAERAVRWSETQKKIQELISKGVTLVYIPSHANCSERCEPWQGRYYTLDGSYQTIDGHEFIPLEVAMNIFVTTKSGKVWRNGLFGFNCRHYPIPYEHGVPTPEKIPAKVINQQRKIEKIQRSMERQIYSLKRASFILRSVNDRESIIKAKRYEERSRFLIEKYKDFSHRNGVPYYPERYNVYL